MSLNDFVNSWLGKRTDYDHVCAYQCVDLILQYLADCYGIKSGVWGNAIDYWTKPTDRLLQSFYKVQGAIQGGDIVILNPTSTNPYGHIMVAINGTTAIEQNGYSGDGDGLNGDEIRYRTIPTNRVAGLLRPKQGTNMSQTSIDITRILAFGVLGRNGAFGTPNALEGQADGDLKANHVDKETNGKIWEFYTSPEGQDWKNNRLPRLINADKTAAALGQQVQQQNQTIGSLTDQVNQLSTRPTVEEVNSLKQAASDAQAKADAALQELGKLKEQQLADTEDVKGFFRKVVEFFKQIGSK